MTDNPPKPKRRRWRWLVAGVVAFAVLGALTSVHCVAEEERSSRTSQVAEFQRPELVAITWRMPKRNSQGSFQPAWRPDGTRLDAEEADWLKSDLEASSLPDWQYNVNLRPLVLIFRCDEDAKRKQAVIPHLRLKEQVLHAGESLPPSKNSLVIASVSPPLTTLRQWPAEIDLDVWTQVAEPEKLKSVDTLPTEPLTVDPGVRWYFDPEAGRSRFGQTGYPAWVLEIDRSKSDPLKEYFFITKLKDDSQKNVWKGIWSGVRRPPLELKITKPIDSDNEITGVEFWRTRFRIERFEKLPTHPELMPQTQ